MDKVNGTSPQGMPLWERQKSQRGHHSSVDGALQAHRQRTSDRHNRVQERLNLVRGMQSDFFPTQQRQTEVAVRNDIFQNQNNPGMAMPPPAAIQNLAPQIEPMAIEAAAIKDMPSFNPMEMDEIYNEASLASISDNAIGLVQKEMANPEEAPIDETPKGSYVDYTV